MYSHRSHQLELLEEELVKEYKRILQQEGAKRASTVDYTWGSQLKVFPSVNYMSQTTEQSGDA